MANIILVAMFQGYLSLYMKFLKFPTKIKKRLYNVIFQAMVLEIDPNIITVNAK